MDLDWCLICEQKTLGSLYCSDDCQHKDYLSAYDFLTPPASPTNHLPSSTIGSINHDNEANDSNDDKNLTKANKLIDLLIPLSPNHSPPRDSTMTTMSTSKVSVPNNPSNAKNKKISATTFTVISTTIDKSNIDPWDTRQRV
ncbi:8142_t:CDS:2 [Ambispora leptoticha]|uniref:8142_t:CDS:1 n=1 Tax=Ambispora leptoticha TaxID=144679 RepID=A0A9N9CEN2_9GLOM|nr:8142_t:CDS:2 [Ambispora leptoticha]